MNLHAIGSGFGHDISSCHGHKPINFEWIYDQPGDIEIYFEPSAINGLHSNCKNKFLWLSESKGLFLDLYERIKNNLDSFRSFKKIFVHDYDLLFTDSIFEYCPPGSNKSWIVDGTLYNKSKLISMIASGKNVTQGHKYRNRVMSYYQNHGYPIDFYGRSHNPFNNKKIPFADYCFSIVIENCQYTHYYTEKIMDCFATGTIPIYWGSSEIHKEFNKDGIILFDENFDFNMLSKELYESKLEAVRDNFEKAKTHKMADDYLYELVKKYV